MKALGALFVIALTALCFAAPLLMEQQRLREREQEERESAQAAAAAATQRAMQEALMEQVSKRACVLVAKDGRKFTWAVHADDGNCWIQDEVVEKLLADSKAQSVLK